MQKNGSQTPLILPDVIPLAPAYDGPLKENSDITSHDVCICGEYTPRHSPKAVAHATPSSWWFTPTVAGILKMVYSTSCK